MSDSFLQRVLRQLAWAGRATAAERAIDAISIGWQQGLSAGLRRETVKRAVGRATGLDFLRVVDARGLRVAGICALFSLLPIVVFLLLSPVTTATAFARLALPFSDIDWPKKTKADERSVETMLIKNFLRPLSSFFVLCGRLS